ncbi:MAG: HlyD family efflux transporter periplasmic adaptor subunit [Gammaproteobacteria bacterium]|nr:HlyD family efflux transporter periplasmic adaptor subunit [Gammaproteobacteria bacterium]
MKTIFKQTGWSIGLLLMTAAFVQAEDAVLHWAAQTTLSTLASGEVARIHVIPGQRVKKGTALIELQQSSFVVTAKALDVVAENARLQANEARAQRDRAQEMYDETMLSDHALEVEKLAYSDAMASYHKALADKERARFLLQQSIVRAPFDAIVLEVNIRVGETVNSKQRSAALITLASASEMMARVSVSSKEAMTLELNNKPQVNIAGKRYEGKIVAKHIQRLSYDSSVSSSNGASVDVSFSIKPGDVAYPGMSVNVEFK